MNSTAAYSGLRRRLGGLTGSITVIDVYKLATEIIMRSWQRKWNEHSTGRAIYSFIPEVGTKVIFQRKGKLVHLIVEFYCMILC